MQVPVAGVAEAKRFDLVLFGGGFDACPEFGEFGAGHHGVFFLDHAARAGGFTDGAPHFPEPILLFRRFRQQDFTAVELAEDGINRLAFAHDAFGVVAIDLDQELRFDAFGLEGKFAKEGLRKVNGFLFHEFQCRRRDPSPENGRNGVASLFGRRKRRQHHHLMGRVGDEPQGRLGDDAQGPFAADHQLREVVARRIFQCLGARANDVARRQDHFKIKDIVLDDAIFHGPESARILRDIATDIATAAACRIDGIKQADGRDGILQNLRDHGGLRGHLQVAFIDVENAVESVGRQNETAVDG